MIVSTVALVHSSSPSFECKWMKNAAYFEGPFFAVRSQSGSLTRCISGHMANASRLLSKLESRATSIRVAAAAGSGAVDMFTGDEGRNSTFEIKDSLYKAVEGIDRGIFGASSEKKSEIEDLVGLLESQNPTPNPTDHLSMVDGCWKLIYSTISILGSKRTKLGLRGFIVLGDFIQMIDVAKGKAVNEIKFNVRGFTMFSGQLVVTASFKISSLSRVDIKFEKSNISPDELMNLFQKNYDLLLAIFNPDGWLEITYVDESMRIGRDDKGNIFILEKVTMC